MSQPYQSPRSMPLASIFLLIAVAGVLAALGGQARSLSPEVAIPASVKGAITGLLLGMIVGLYHFRRLRGALIGVATGCIVGALSGPIMAVKQTQSTQLLLVSAVGSAAVILLAIVCRFVNDRDPISRKSWD